MISTSAYSYYFYYYSYYFSLAFRVPSTDGSAASHLKGALTQGSHIVPWFSPSDLPGRNLSFPERTLHHAGNPVSQNLHIKTAINHRFYMTCPALTSARDLLTFWHIPNFPEVLSHFPVISRYVGTLQVPVLRSCNLTISST